MKIIRLALCEYRRRVCAYTKCNATDRFSYVSINSRECFVYVPYHIFCCCCCCLHSLVYALCTISFICASSRLLLIYIFVLQLVSICEMVLFLLFSVKRSQIDYGGDDDRPTDHRSQQQQQQQSHSH